MLGILVTIASSRDLRTLYVGEGASGDCFSASCDFDTASHILRNGDTIIFQDRKIAISSYPSPMSDLLHTAMFMNVTFVAKDKQTVFDGQMLAGEQLFEVKSAARFCWVKFIGFTFVNFQKHILTRIIAESQWPLVNFKDCNFEECKNNSFVIMGGSFQFDNCLFKNIQGRPIKAVTESFIEATDCTFQNCGSCFLQDCDAIFTNCQFKDCHGERGGAIYSSKATLNIHGCKFVNNKAAVHGGAIYIREMVAEFGSEITSCAFKNNYAKENGTAVYSFVSTFTLKDNQFSDEEKHALVENQSNGDRSGNEYSSSCDRLLEYSPEQTDFDPYIPDPSQDIDVEVPVKTIIEL